MITNSHNIALIGTPMGKLFIGSGTSLIPAIVTKEIIDKKRFNADYNTWVGVLDDNGKLNYETDPSEIIFTGVKDIGDWALTNKFCYKKSMPISVSFPDLEVISGENALNYAFYQSGITYIDFGNLTEISGDFAMASCFTNCTGLTFISFPNLTTISGKSGCHSMLSGCSNITDADLRRVTYVSGNSSMDSMFSGNNALTKINLNSLKSVTNTTSSTVNAMQQMFKNCSNLTSIRFPSLVEISGQAFGSSSSNDIFDSCSKLRQIHFRIDAENTIKSLDRYAEKWGATNATIYFDLVGTITVDGTNYERDEYNSLYDGTTETHVAWKDSNGNTIYTIYADGSEPDVGTEVYADAGLTQIGTISTIA